MGNERTQGTHTWLRGALSHFFHAAATAIICWHVHKAKRGERKAASCARSREFCRPPGTMLLEPQKRGALPPSPSHGVMGSLQPASRESVIAAAKLRQPSLAHVRVCWFFVEADAVRCSTSATSRPPVFSESTAVEGAPLQVRMLLTTPTHSSHVLARVRNCVS